jgi:hypothetical protein
MDRLRLIPAIRSGGRHADASWKTQQKFLDFVVNRQSLWQKVGKPLDLVTVLALDEHVAPDKSALAVRRLILKEPAELLGGRRQLLICPECGDIGCGAITASIEKDKTGIVWRSFGYENDDEQEVKFKSYEDVGPFTFEAADYETALLQQSA